MGVTEDLADDLARDALEAAEAMGDETLTADIARLMGASSSTLEEAFLNAVRVRRAAKRGRKFLEDRIAAFEKKGGTPD